MSRLAEKMNRAGRVEAAPLGFGVAAERRATPTMLCLLRLDKDQLNKAEAPGADALIITGLESGKLAEALKRLGGVSAGVRLTDAQRATVAAAREAGADFVLLDEESPAEALLEEKIGLVLRIGSDLGDTELRALAGLHLNALAVAPIGESFSVRRLTELRRLSLLSQTPLLIEVTPEIAASRLEALREAGVGGVILDGKYADRLGALREAVLSLPARGRRREERVEALLPSLTAVPAAEEEEEEDQAIALIFPSNLLRDRYKREVQVRPRGT